MTLARLSEFRRLKFTPASAPKLSTLRRQASRIPGARKVGKLWYVDLDEFDRKTAAPPATVDDRAAPGLDQKESIRTAIEDRVRELKRDPLLEGLF